ncbi:MAG: hypothetical protein MR411_01590 [Tenericutes bacterium]|nr:hypothetical protein [Mycoplasmatota bacterium]MDY3801866.1 BRCT domain-containing protein [Bacilli bacterium]
MIKNEYIAINGRLESMTKKEAKEKILELGGFFQQDINSKTTIVINGYQPTKKKKQKIKELEKNGQIIKIITEKEFTDLLKNNNKNLLDELKKLTNKTINNTKKITKDIYVLVCKKTKEILNNTKRLYNNSKEKIKNKINKQEIIKKVENKTKEKIKSKINKQDFIKKIENKTKEKDIKKIINKKNIFSFKTLRIIFSIILILLGLTKMITIPAKLVFAIAGICVLPFIQDNILKNIIFQVVVPISLIMISFSLNIKITLSTVTGTWYSDTMTLKIGDKKTEMDVIDSEGRHILTGTNKFDNGFFEIKTKYKTFRYEFDAINDTLCVLNDDNTCRYYLDRVE